MHEECSLPQQFLAIFTLDEDIDLSIVINDDKSSILQLLETHYLLLSYGQQSYHVLRLNIELLYFNFEVFV